MRRGNSVFIDVTARERAAVLGSMGFLGLLVGVVNLTHGRFDVLLIFLSFLLLLITLAIPLMVYRRNWGWFHPLVFLPVWTLVTSVLPSLGVITDGLESHSGLPGMSVQDLNHLVVQSLLLQALGWAMFYIGFMSTRRMHTMVARFPEPRAVPLKMLFVIGVSVLGLMVLIRGVGGLDPLLLQRGLRADQRIHAQVGGQWAFLASRVLPTACLVWLALRPATVRRVVFWLVFGVGLLMGFAATGSRSGIVLPMVMALAIWALRTGRVPYLRAAMLGVLAVVAVGLLGEFRRETWQVNTVRSVRVESGLASGFMRGIQERAGSGGENSALVAILARVPDEVDLLYGRSYLSIPAAPIPRRVWSGKPEAGGRLTGHLIFGHHPGSAAVPPGTVGEAFWNFHVPGVVIVFAMWGMTMNWLAGVYRGHARDGGMVVLYILSLFGFSLNTDALYNWFHGMVIAFLALVLFCGWPRIVSLRKIAVGVAN